MCRPRYGLDQVIAYEGEAPMTEWVTLQNIERFKQLLAEEKDPCDDHKEWFARNSGEPQPARYRLSASE